MIADDLITLINFTLWLNYTCSSIFFVPVLTKFHCLGFKQPHPYTYIQRSVARFYLPRKEGDRNLMSVEDSVDKQTGG